MKCTGSLSQSYNVPRSYVVGFIINNQYLAGIDVVMA